MSRMRVAAAAGVLCALGSCNGPLGPSSSVVGDWSVRLAPAHFAYIDLHIEKSGSGLSGTACMSDDVDLVYSRVPLVIEYPNVSFVVKPEHTAACCSNMTGTSFHATFKSEDSLTGYESHSPDYALTGSRGGHLCDGAK